MNINRTFSIPEHTVKELNRQVRNQSRSEFVAKAIKHRLNGCESSKLDIETKRLMAILHARDDCTPEIKALLEMELMK